MERDSKLIPNRLREHRRIFGYKKSVVARLLGVSNPKKIGRWERGIEMPNGHDLLKLSVIYRTFPNALYDEYYRTLRKDIFQFEERMFGEARPPVR